MYYTCVSFYIVCCVHACACVCELAIHYNNNYYIHVRACVYIYTYAYMCVHVCVHACVHLCTCECMCVCAYMHVCVSCLYIRVCMYNYRHNYSACAYSMHDVCVRGEYYNCSKVLTRQIVRRSTFVSIFKHIVFCVKKCHPILFVWKPHDKQLSFF